MRLPSVKFQFRFHPLITLVPLFFIRIAAVKPLFHSLLITYWQFATAITDEELLLLLDKTALETELLMALLDERDAVEFAELVAAILLALLVDAEPGVVPTIPKGAGCAAQVEREIQLLLFS